MCSCGFLWSKIFIQEEIEIDPLVTRNIVWPRRALTNLLDVFAGASTQPAPIFFFLQEGR
jgi:hypothetical protein